MGAGFAQGLSRFGQVAGPVAARGMQTRQALLAAAMERALREQQIKQALTQNVLSGLAVPGATLEAQVAGEQMTHEAGMRRQRTDEASTAQREAESTRAVRGEKIGQTFDFPMAKQKLEQAEREAKVSRFQLELIEQYGKENADREQRVGRLKEQALVAGDPVAVAGIEKALKEESLKQEQAKTKVMKSVEELNRFKAAGGDKEQKPISVDETSAAKNISAIATVQAKNTQDPKKTTSVQIVTPGAAQNMAATALNYARQGDRAAFDKYVNLESAKLVNRIFADPRKQNELATEFSNAKKESPGGWFSGATKVGETAGVTLTAATTINTFKAQRKADAQQAIKDELEAIWTMGQGQASVPSRPTSLEQLGGMEAEEEAAQPDTGTIQDFINGLAAQGVPAEQIRQQVKEQFGI